MVFSLASLLGSLIIILTISTNIVPALSSLEDNELMQRNLRSFPYSVSFYRMLGHDRQMRPYYGVNDEIAAIIDSMNSIEDEQQPQQQNLGQRARRSDGVRGTVASTSKFYRNLPAGLRFHKRYACRFKFCRIYDS